MNEVNLIGNILGNLNFEKTKDGIEFAQTLLKVKKQFKEANNDRDFDIFEITMYGNTIEYAKEIVKDMKKVIVRGHLVSRNYPEDGLIKYSASIIVDRIDEWEVL